MKTVQKISVFLLASFLWIGCANDEETSKENCANTCNYTIASDETAGSVPTSINNTYNLIYDYAQPDSPFTNGTKGTFIIQNNELTVTIEGTECITLKNPILRGQDNYLFIDNCRNNITYNLSLNTDGSFNEINIEPIGTGWLGQFHQ